MLCDGLILIDRPESLANVLRTEWVVPVESVHASPPSMS